MLKKILEFVVKNSNSESSPSFEDALASSGIPESDVALVLNSGLYDEDFYLSSNPDIVAARVEFPLLHFLISGGREGRSPSAQFDASWYLEAYPDVRQANLNPLLHYLRHGRTAGYESRPASGASDAPGPTARAFVGGEYNIERVDSTKIVGWAWLPAEPTRRIEIELVDGGAILARTRAEIYRNDLELAGKADGNCGFEIDIPAELRDGRSRTVDLHIAGEADPFYQLKNVYFGKANEVVFGLAGVECTVELVSDTRIVGWAWLPAAPSRRIEIELVEGMRVLARTPADIYRKDLEVAGKRGGRCGFEFVVPADLRDGRLHPITLRVAGEDKSFRDIEARRFATIHHDFVKFSPFAIEGVARLSSRRAVPLEIAVRLGGEIVHRAKTGPDEAFAWQAAPLPVGEIVARARGSSYPCSDRGAAQPTTLALEVTAEDVVLRAERVQLWPSADGHLVLHIEEISERRIVGTALALAEGASALVVQVDDLRASFAFAGPIAPFALDIRGLRLEDGEHTVRIGIADGNTGELLSSFARPLFFKRFDVNLDIVDDRIVGALRDRWADARETAIEVLVDGRPVSLEIARQTFSEDDDLRFSAGLSARWRDGRAHRVQVRIAGSDRFFPSRPLLFRAGAAIHDALVRVERDLDSVSGYIILPWSAQSIAEVSLWSGDEKIGTAAADLPHPALAAESLVPVNRGFRLGLPQNVSGNLVIRVAHDDQILSEFRVGSAPQAYVLKDPGHGRKGACFVAPNPGCDALAREETRSILFAAAAAIRAGVAPVTVAFAEWRPALDAACGDLRQLLTDLVGKANSACFDGVDFVALPEPVLPSTAYGNQRYAHALDQWVRSNAFSLVAGPSRSGILAYCVSSKRQGLLSQDTRIVILADTFAVLDRLACDELVDQPELLMEEALERQALSTVDGLIAAPGIDTEAVEQVSPGAGAKIERLAMEVGHVPVTPLLRSIDARRWLIFAAPLSTRSGLVLLCDALDRLMRRPGVDHSQLGILFIGTEDFVRGQRAGSYIRSRAKKWPFGLAVRLDLAFDAMASVLAGYGEAGLSIVLPPLAGSVWDGLVGAAGLARVAVDQIRAGNATDLADAIEAALTGTGIPVVPPPGSSRLGAALGERATPRDPARGTPAPARRPRVSVCITHFNRPTLLRQTIASILACGYPDLEIVVVDDGSSVPGVATELAEIEGELKEVGGRVIRQPNNYLGAARNTAARHATGEMIVFMDDDNLAHPGMIDAFVNTSLRTGADIVTSYFGLFDGTDAIDPGADIPKEIGIPLAPDTGLGVLTNCFGDANMLITRAAFDQVGGFTEDFGRGHEDWEFFARASTLGLRHELMNRACFWYRVAEQSMLRGRESVNVDLQRNIRAYSHALPTGIYRMLMLAQGLTMRWDRPAKPSHLPSRKGLSIANRLAYGRVAVIMRTKDRPILLKRAVDSVLSQTFADWCLVVVNDGGAPEPVREILDARREALQDRILLINNPTSTGMENASNAGVTNSASEFLVIHDDDDAWDPHFLERCVSYLDASPPDVGGVITHATLVVEDIVGEDVVERQRFPFNNIEAVDLVSLSVENQFPPICFLFKRAVTEVVGLFDGELPVLGDWDFHFRVAKIFRIDVLRERLAFYHHRSANTTNQYGNTVVAQKDTHRIQRTLYINQHIRQSLSAPQTSGEGNLLFAGEIHRELVGKVSEIKQHMDWLEKLLNDRAGHMSYVESLIKNHDSKLSYIESLLRNLNR